VPFGGETIGVMGVMPIVGVGLVVGVEELNPDGGLPEPCNPPGKG